jgi:peptidoglycan/LPS O-acetylase OafA/YrhL
MNKQRIEFVNILRGPSALCVLISHHWSDFWLNRVKVQDLLQIPGLPAEQVMVPVYIQWLNMFPHFSWGPFGVALFFLISGFVIPFSLQNLHAMTFLRNRFFRIVPTYIVGFGISILALWVGLWYFESDWPYTLQEMMIHTVPGIRDLMHSPNIDGVIWTLEIEMKFYLICALSIIWLQQYSLKVFMIPLALFLLSLGIDWQLGLWVISHSSPNQVTALFQLGVALVHASLYLIFMFIGVLFHYVHEGRLSQQIGLIGGLGLVILFLTQWRMGVDVEIITEVWSYLLALLVFTMAYYFRDVFRANRVTDFLADISYPLYVTHCVAGYTVLYLLLEYGLNATFSLMCVLSLCISLAWCLHRWVEVPYYRRSVGADS